MVSEVQNMDAIKEGNVLVDFYTSTCGPCRALNPVLEEISKEFTDLKVAKIEVTKNPDMSQRFGVMSVPTVMFLKNSQVKEITRGFSGKQAIRSMVEKHMDHKPEVSCPVISDLEDLSEIGVCTRCG